MTSQGNAYSRFQRAVLTGNLQLIEAAAAELPHLGLDDALIILSLLAHSGDTRFDRAAARWIGRLLTETPAGLRDARFALALVERLPVGRDALHELARLALTAALLSSRIESDDPNRRRRWATALRAVNRRRRSYVPVWH